MRRSAAIVLILTSLPAVLAAGRSSRPAPVTPPVRIERSVVRLVNHAQRGVWFSPWEVTQVSELSGSGFVVAGGAIMTNAHVVSDSRLLLVFLDRDPTPYPATVVHIAFVM